MIDPPPLLGARIRLRVPRASDARALYEELASDAEVTRWVGWPRHRSLADTEAFLDFAASEWHRWPAGPLLIERLDGELLGTTGLAFETDTCASTGYVLRRAAWGQGYATEALGLVCTLAASLGLSRLYALCHVEHTRSAAVLERAAFRREGVLARYMRFPNITQATPQDVFCYARTDGMGKSNDPRAFAVT